MKSEGHPNLDQLRAFDLGQLHALERLEVEGHVARCDTCCRKLEALPSDGLVALLRVSAGTPRPDTHAPDAASVHTPSEPGMVRRTEVPAELADHPRYRVLAFVGAGGMGAVFKAEHRLMERVVALKVLNRSLTDRPAAVERFRLEARAAARLAHPNIVTAHDAEQAGEAHFLVTEFVEGKGLDRWVEEKGPLPVAQACDFARQAALGLQHAHERGMVHRDVKPGNLLVTPAGQVKVLDFGLARFVSESGSGRLPQAGAVVGTPDYMAPEQALEPQQADIRADLYGLGCTLYHLLAGRPPFPEPTVLQKLMAHQEQTAPRLTELRGDVPEALADVVERLLAKDPARRYQTPVAVAAALEPFAQGSPPAPPSNWQEPRGNRPGRSRFGKAALAAALLLSLGALLAIVLYIHTDRGRLTIKTDAPGVRVVVTQGGRVVTVFDPRATPTVELKSGAYEITLEGGAGLRLETDHFTLSRGGHTVLEVLPMVGGDRPPAARPAPTAASWPPRP